MVYKWNDTPDQTNWTIEYSFNGQEEGLEKKVNGLSGYDEIKNILPYEYMYILCRRFNNIPIHKEFIKKIIDILEGDEEFKTASIKSLKGLYNTYGNKK